jgi:uncharacterized protein (DUF1697 family)
MIEKLSFFFSQASDRTILALIQSKRMHKKTSRNAKKINAFESLGMGRIPRVKYLGD